MKKAFRLEVLPVRLIDVFATLLHATRLGRGGGGIHFMVPSSWDFHVISHTWSLEVRNFSEQIGEQIKPTCSEGGENGRSLYNAYFEEVDLRGEAAFHGLMHFLRLLAQAGVTYVWFDALCINQRDKQEKEREIANMGAYYHNSRGCYVIVHGIGQGYYFWNADDFVGVSPRWFHRVWTLQELLLPAQVLFITQLPLRVQRLARGLIHLHSTPSIGFCRCCILQGLLKEPQDCLEARPRAEFLCSCGIEVEYIEAVNGYNAGIEIVFPRMPINHSSPLLGGDSPAPTCPTCGSPSLIRQCEQHESASEELYMVERKVYLFLMYLDTFFPLTISYGNIPRIFSLIKSLEEQNWDPSSVFSEISRRDCTNDEDRILGVLGLLGVGGEMQVRTGTTAKEQLINLGKYCISEDPDLLLRLCIAEPVGGPFMGISWAPNLEFCFSVCEYAGEVCGFSFDFIEECFGPQFELDPGVEATACGCISNSQSGVDVEQRPLNMSIVKESMDRLLLQLDRLSNCERKVEFLDCSFEGITLEACVAAGKVLPYKRLSRQDRAAVKNALSKANAAEGSTILKDSHIPTHCIHFEKSNVFLPLLVSLSQEMTRAGSGELEPVLVMADAIRPWNMIYMRIGTCKHARQALAGRQTDLHYVEDGSVRIELDVWVVLLGSVSNLYSLMMVCVGYDDEVMELLREDNMMPEGVVRELSKVGIMVLPTSVGNEIFMIRNSSASAEEGEEEEEEEEEGGGGGGGQQAQMGERLEKERYLLGGYGDDLSMFVRVRGVKCPGELRRRCRRLYTRCITC